MGGVWVSLLLLLYLAPGAPGLGDRANSSRPVTLHQLGNPPPENNMVTPSIESWRMRRSRAGGVERLRRRTRSHYREEPEPEDYQEGDEGSADPAEEDEEEGDPLVDEHVPVEEDADDEAPPDSTEMRERYRVSEHEHPREPSTRPNYTGEGHWARPPAHVAQRIPFVPVQNYAQVC